MDDDFEVRGLHEQLSEERAAKGEAFDQRIALFTAILATLAAVTSFLGGHTQNEALLHKNEAVLIKGAIQGMLASLDPHSSYVDALDYENLRIMTEGNYGGLGLTVQMEDGAIKVVSPQEDSPAARAGVKSGDYITHIDGFDARAGCGGDRKSTRLNSSH